MELVTKRSTATKLEPMCLEHPPTSKKIVLPKKGPFVTLVILSIFLFSVINGSDQSSINLIIPPTDRSDIIGYTARIIDLVATNDGGLIFIYRTETCGGIEYLLVKTNSSGMIQWKKSLIETGSDLNLYHIIQTLDGYVLAGDKTIKYRNSEICLFKIDMEGNKLWEVIYKNNTITEIIQLEDGGFAIVGRNGVTTSLGSIPILIRTDKNGNMVWNQTFSSSIQLKSLIQIDDGFVLLGGKLSGYRTYAGGVILIKIDEEGKVLWNKDYNEFGHPGYVVANKIIQTVDGIIFTGFGKWTSTYQILMIKIDSDGEEIWRREFDLYGFFEEDLDFLDQIQNLMQTKSGDLLFTGYRMAVPLRTQLIKTNDNGTMQWNQSYVGVFSNLVEMSEGSYALAGYISIEGTTEACVINVDRDGTVLWRRVYTGSAVDEDWATSAIQTQDGGFAFAGTTSSYGAEKTDIWLVKTDAYGQVEWNITFGAEGDDEANYLFQTATGDFFLVGSTKSPGWVGDWWGPTNNWEIFIAKADATGNRLWEKTYKDYRPAISGPYAVQTSDGGVVCACISDSEGLWLAKIDGKGGIKWEQTYNTWRWGRFKDNLFQATTDGFIIEGAFVMGEKTIGPNVFSVHGISAIQLDSYGNILWTKFHNSETSESLVKLDGLGNIEWIQNFSKVTNFVSNLLRYVQKTPDNGFICILEEHYDPIPADLFEPNEEEYYYLVKVDAQGMITWTKKYLFTKLKAGQGIGNKILNMYITLEGDYLLIHEINFEYPEIPFFFSNLILEKVNAQGVSQWTQTWNGTLFEPDWRVQLFGKHSPMGGYPLALFQLEDEDILLAGVFTTGRLFISKFSLEFGTILWNQTLPEDYLGGFNDQLSEYFLAKYNPSLIAIGDSWIVNIHQNGSLLWNYSFYPFQFSSVVPTNDDGFILAGHVSAMPGQYGVSRDAFVMKLDKHMTIEWSRIYGSSSSGVFWSYEIEESTPSNDSNFASSFPFLSILLVLCATSFYKKKSSFMNRFIKNPQKDN